MTESNPSSPPEAGKKACCQCKSGKKVKPSELPLYGNPYPPKDIILNQETGVIEDGFRATREAIAPLYSYSQEAAKRSIDFVNTGVAHSKATYQSVTQDGHVAEKALAIACGGALGFLLASRKGFFKKLLYTSIGFGGATAACYPKESGEMVEISTYIAKKKGPELVKEFTGYDLSPYINVSNGKKVTENASKPKE